MLGLELVSDGRPDRIADHDFARICCGNEPRTEIHGLAQCSEFIGPALGADRANECDARVDADADW